MLFALLETECDHHLFHVPLANLTSFAPISTPSTPYKPLFPAEDEEGPGTSSAFGVVELSPAVAVSVVVGTAVVGAAEVDAAEVDTADVDAAEVDATEVAAAGVLAAAEVMTSKGAGKEATTVAPSIFLVSMVSLDVVRLDRRTSTHCDI